jgi:hypothetical protein
MKLTYTWKTTFNINGTTIHSTLAIPLNKNLTKLNALNGAKMTFIIKIYYQLCLFIINEISLVNNRMLIFIELIYI